MSVLEIERRGLYEWFEKCGEGAGIEWPECTEWFDAAEEGRYSSPKAGEEVGWKKSVVVLLEKTLNCGVKPAAWGEIVGEIEGCALKSLSWG